MREIDEMPGIDEMREIDEMPGIDEIREIEEICGIDRRLRENSLLPGQVDSAKTFSAFTFLTFYFKKRRRVRILAGAISDESGKNEDFG